MDEPRISDYKLFYEVEKGSFASGLYATVRRARSRKTGQLYAAKFSPKRKENFNEIRLLSRLKNNYIITFKDAFATDKNLITVMEFAPGGDLQSLIDADIVLPEIHASKYISQLLHGLDYMHNKSIAHLDIKPQNLLLMGDFPDCQIKICDFELSRVVGMGEKEVLGTPDYVAPEILTYTELSTKADIWSTGIVTYVLLTGFSPFGGDSDSETFNNIINSEIDFPNELFDEISLSGIDFMRAMLEKNPRSRPTANFALSNDWLKTFRARPKNKSKSSFDLSEGRTKSREKLMQRVVGAGLRKTMSKSREQLWRSKMKLSASSEKIARWASVSEFPSLNEDGSGGHSGTILPASITESEDPIILNSTKHEEEDLEIIEPSNIEEPIKVEICTDSPKEEIIQNTFFINNINNENDADSDGQKEERESCTTYISYSDIEIAAKNSEDVITTEESKDEDFKEIVKTNEESFEEFVPRRSVKELIQAFSRNEVKNLEVIDEESEESGNWSKKSYKFKF